VTRLGELHEAEAEPSEPSSASSGPSPRARDWISIGIVAVAFLIPLRGLLNTQGPPMEEGFMLVFPERVLAGDIPNKDFLHLYGPGSLWALAGVFEVFGTSLTVERLVGLLQQVGLVFGVFALARRWGRIAAVTSGIAAVMIIVPPIGLTALAWVGAVALGLLGIAAGMRARETIDPRRAGRWALGAGVLFGLAVLYRLDLAVAGGLAILVLLPSMTRPLKMRLLGGAALGLAPFVVHFATAGVDTALRGMVLDPVVYLRGGRRLPLPPPWDHFDGFLQIASDLRVLDWPIPALQAPAQLSVWFWALLGSIAVLLLVGIRAMRRAPREPAARILLAVALFSIGILPQALQRADSTHLAWVSCVPIGFLPVALIELVRQQRGGFVTRRRALVCGGGVVAFLLFVIPYFTVRQYVDFSLRSVGIHTQSHPITRGDRTFYHGQRAAARAANELIVDVERITKPGDRLFVGPKDLRKTPYSDAFLYYLFPELPPATYYIEMDPGVANADDSGLVDDLDSADVAILSSVWDEWDEPNDSRTFGPDAPNRLLREKFCEVDDYDGLYTLYRRCKP
jgi:Dolichyl-phosphate-mannose-protein mannosyltransferase